MLLGLGFVLFFVLCFCRSGFFAAGGGALCCYMLEWSWPGIYGLRVLALIVVGVRCLRVIWGALGSLVCVRWCSFQFGGVLCVAGWLCVCYGGLFLLADPCALAVTACWVFLVVAGRFG